MPIYYLLILCFFFSGATALIYEVIWVRLLALKFGSTIYAVGVVMTAYMSGLSLGSLFFGRRADRGRSLLKSYAWLEFGIALTAFLSPFILEEISIFYLDSSPTEMSLWKLTGLRYILSITVLLLPTFLMGGTLPVLSKYLIQNEELFSRRLSVLYSINTLGGVLGVTAAGFFFIREYGLSTSLKITVTINMVIGLYAYYLGSIPANRRNRIEVSQKPDKRESPLKLSAINKYAMVAILISGIAAMIYEVAWSRLLVGVIGSTTYAFSLILMGFLSGIALGSLAVGILFRRRKPSLFTFVIIEIMIGVVALLTIFQYRFLPDLMLLGIRAADGSYASVVSFQFLIVIVLLLIPTTLLGATFPIIAALCNRGESERGRRIGEVYAVNTAGAIIGSALAAFFLLPLLGSTDSIKLAAFLNIGVGAAGLLLLRRFRLFAGAALLLMLPLLPLSIPERLLDTGVAVYGNSAAYSVEARHGQYLYQKEGLNSTVSVTRAPNGVVTLKVNGKSDASTSRDMGTQLAVGYFPSLFHPEPREAMVIGLGSGVTAKAVMDNKTIQNLEVVEIEPTVVEAASYFYEVNQNILENPSVKLIVDDARNHLVTTRKRYDLIISEPSNPWISGIGNLFTIEYYQQAVSRLKEGGIFCQWVQMYNMRFEDQQMIFRTFSSVFKNISLWKVGGGDLLLIGSVQPIPQISYAEINRRIASRGAWDLKAYLDISNGLDLLAYYVTDYEGVVALSGEAPLNSDDLPLLEFNAPFALYSNDHRIISLLNRKSSLPTQITLPQGIDLEHELFYRRARNYIKAGSFGPMAAQLREAIFEDHEDPRFMVLQARLAGSQLSSAELESRLQAVLNRYPATHEANFFYAQLIGGADHRLAQSYLKRAIRLTPNSYRYTAELARHYIFTDDFDTAIQYLEQASQLPHTYLEDARLFYDLGFASFKSGEFSEAIGSLQKSLEIVPNNPDARLTLADSYLRNGERLKACSDYRKLQSDSISPEGQSAIQRRISSYCSDQNL